MCLLPVHSSLALALSTLLLWPHSLLVHAASPVNTSPTLHTRRGALQGLVIDNGPRFPPVEAYLGVPYAAPPTRFMPPTSPPTWTGVRQARSFAAVCPQRLPPLLENRTAALETMSLQRYLRLRHLSQYVQHQSEDCLYLNVYRPARSPSEAVGSSSGLPVMVFVPGDESFSYGSGNSVDGSVLAGYGRAVVVTLNYRLGVLGFLNTNLKPARAVANYGLLDLVAALEFVRLTAADFGGDPANVTVLGQGTGAACVNHLMTSASAPLGVLFRRAILMTGSSLAPWALLLDPLNSTRRLASSLHCPLHAHQLLHCLRRQPLRRLLDAVPDQFHFVPAFGPSLDGIVIGDELLSSRPLYSRRLESYQLLIGVWTGAAGSFELAQHLATASSSDVTSSDVTSSDVTSNDVSQHWLRTYVQNTYSYHLNEIASTVAHQYTDWTAQAASPYAEDGSADLGGGHGRLKDQLFQLFSDARYLAPAVHTASLLGRSKRAYFYVMEERQHNSEPLYPDGELPMVFGHPLLATDGSGRRWTDRDRDLSLIMMTYWTNFARTGDPNQPRRASKLDGPILESVPHWMPYDRIERRHLLLGDICRMDSHYRADKVALWLRLVPEIHSRGSSAATDVHHQHHTLEQQADRHYRARVRTVHPASWHLQLPPQQSQLPADTDSLSAASNVSAMLQSGSTAETEESPAENMNSGKATQSGSAMSQPFGSAYRSALSLTVAIGCSLLVLNMLTLAAVYYQRQKQRRQEMSAKQVVTSSTAGRDADADCRCVLIRPTTEGLNNMSSSTLDCEINSTLVSSVSAGAVPASADGAGVGAESSAAMSMYDASGGGDGGGSDLRSRERAQPPPQFADCPLTSARADTVTRDHCRRLHNDRRPCFQQQQRDSSIDHYESGIVIDENAVCPYTSGSLSRQRVPACDLVNSNSLAAKKIGHSSRETLSELTV